MRLKNAMIVSRASSGSTFVVTISKALHSNLANQAAMTSVRSEPFTCWAHFLNRNQFEIRIQQSALMSLAASFSFQSCFDSSRLSRTTSWFAATHGFRPQTQTNDDFTARNEICGKLAKRNNLTLASSTSGFHLIATLLIFDSLFAFRRTVRAFQIYKHSLVAIFPCCGYKMRPATTNSIRCSMIQFKKLELQLLATPLRLNQILLELDCQLLQCSYFFSTLSDHRQN